MEKWVRNQRTGYAKVKIDSDFLDDRRFSIEGALKYLQNEYSESKVEKKQQATGHLPFPYRTEKLQKEDFNLVDSDYSKFVLNRFIAQVEEWDDKHETIHGFELDLKEISSFLSKYNLVYPCYILDVGDVDYTSKKVHSFYKDTEGFLFDYYFLVVFGTSQSEIILIEIALD